ncbi:MAG: hydroxyacid dehydrogenase [Deltaproteobacteria bacterium]|jgi:D-3-phosphoglycerate dehydrogenase|nr:hydroxyacid dehydrogenase [Deltaproteobacteria bacterium]
MASKILISDKIESVCPDRLREAGFEVDEKSGLAPQGLEAIIGGYHGLVVRSATSVTAGVLERGAQGNLRIVGRAGAGLDNIDLPAAGRLGIKVVNTPGLNANAVAELTVALMIVLARNLWPAMESIKAGRWEKRGLSGHEIAGKTVGLLGIGAVGRLVAAKAGALGLRVLAHDPILAPEAIGAAGAEPVGFDDLFRRSDFVSLHLPKTRETANIVGPRALSLMRPGAFIVNCARGGLVDEEALLAALGEGRLAGAATDVFAKEPPDPSPLMALPNFVAVPHLGASTEEAQLAVAEKVALLLIAHLKDPAGAGTAREK